MGETFRPQTTPRHLTLLDGALVQIVSAGDLILPTLRVRAATADGVSVPDVFRRLRTWTARLEGVQ
jgi:hypothetical protein